MPYTPPTVNYSTTLNGTYTTLTGVQSVSIRRGRTYFQDNFPGTRCSIELIPANSYATPLAIGQWIDVRPTNSASSPAYFAGRITDVERVYDMPYNSGTGAAPGDRIIVTAAGPTGLVASDTVGSYTFLYPTAYLQAFFLTLDRSDVYIVPAIDKSILTSATSVTNAGVFDVVNKFARTEQVNLDDLDAGRTTNPLNPGVVQPQMVWYSGYNSAVATFSDAGTGTKYNRLTFRSAAQSTFNSVNVLTDGLATQNVQAAIGPYNSLDYDTFSATTAAALNLANYLYLLLSQQNAPAPFSINLDTAVDDTFLQYCYVASRIPTSTWIGGQATIRFRGATYAAAVQGINLNFYADQANAEFIFSPTLGQPFTLNSSSFGILNTNRLGYP
jgi:hypothetical protein